MTPLLRRAATCAGLAACGWSTLLAAQRAAPIVQQSPNGLYQLSITDAGIELHGPKGTVKINDSGIQIGGPGTMQINIESGGDVLVRGDRDARVQSGRHMTLTADGEMQASGSAAVKISGGASSSLTAPQLSLGCDSGRPAARQADQVTVGGNTGIIAAGSPRVLVC